MAGTGIRRTRTTLLDQLSTMEPTILRDLLKVCDEDNASTAAAGRNSGAVTLASVLEAEKSGGRTLLDIIREEDEARGVMPTEPTPPSEADEGPAGRVSLMTLLTLAEGARGEDSIAGNVSGGEAGVAVVAVAEEEEEVVKAVAVADDRILCCVCMVRRKGAAFIPCGHTFCRLCTRELWTGRGSCPLCNSLILDILDIF